ncbi:DUF3265 domain-containing protein [Vibrio parahaemolyticus]|nr:DUF3265 domain-containing protein [Vibrio parahaemolyticus]
MCKLSCNGPQEKRSYSVSRRDHSTAGFKFLTNNLRVIRHAWHFYYALVLVVKVVCGSIDIACLTP